VGVGVEEVAVDVKDSGVGVELSDDKIVGGGEIGGVEFGDPRGEVDLFIHPLPTFDQSCFPFGCGLTTPKLFLPSFIFTGLDFLPPGGETRLTSPGGELVLFSLIPSNNIILFFLTSSSSPSLTSLFRSMDEPPQGQ
jgi:hypothetical protein